MDPVFLAIQLLNGVQQGLLLFLIASGLTLIFGVMGVINLAHGAFYMLGAYAAYSLTEMTGNLLTAILLGIPLAVMLGWVFERIFFRWLYDRDHLEQVLLTYGLILIIDEMRSVIWGNDPHGVPVPEWLGWSIPLTETLSYPVYRLAAGAACLLRAAAMPLLPNRTRHRTRVRAGDLYW